MKPLIGVRVPTPQQIMEQVFLTWAEKKLGGISSATKELVGDQNIVYRLQSPKGTCFLKIGKGLEKEWKRLLWVASKQPVPQILGFKEVEGVSALLLSGIEGTNLKSAGQELGIEKIIDILASALRRFHSTDITHCPFGVSGKGKVLVHGDACLPNIMVSNGKLSGYIDLEDMRIDDKEVDLAAGVWSLQFNFGPGFGIQFLQKYGIENPSEEMVRQLHQRYEDMKKAWGLE